MKKITRKRIGTRIYDTETAKKIASDALYYHYDGHIYDGDLYLKRTGEFFFVTIQGGIYMPVSEYWYDFIPLDLEDVENRVGVRDLKDICDPKFKDIIGMR